MFAFFNAGTIEEKIYQRQISKQALSGAVVDFSKGSEHIRFSVEELRNLFTLHEDSNCVTHDLLECDCMGKKDNQGEQLLPYFIHGIVLMLTVLHPTFKLQTDRLQKDQKSLLMMVTLCSQSCDAYKKGGELCVVVAAPLPFLTSDPPCRHPC